MPSIKAATSNLFALRIDGGTPGLVQEVSGISQEADLITTKVGTMRYAQKTIATQKFSDVTLKLGLAAGREAFDWIQSAIRGEAAQKSFSVHQLGYDLSEKARVDFFGGLITEVTLPGVKADDKELSFITIKLAVEDFRYFRGTGEKILGDFSDASKQKECSRNMFAFDGPVDGAHVKEVSDITLTLKTAEQHLGSQLHPLKVAAGAEFNDVTLTMNAGGNAMDEWADLAHKFISQGLSSATDEFSVTVTYKTPSGDDLMDLTLYQCGVKKFELPSFSASSEEVATFKTDLYVERAVLEPRFS